MNSKKKVKKLSKNIKDWKNVDFFWGDERIVSKRSKNSNYNLVNKSLFKDNKIKKKQIFSIKIIIFKWSASLIKVAFLIFYQFGFL